MRLELITPNANPYSDSAKPPLNPPRGVAETMKWDFEDGVMVTTAFTSARAAMRNGSRVRGIGGYRYLNDPSELRHGIFLAQDMIKTVQAKAGHAKYLCQMMADLFSHENFSDHLQFFIASFSRDRDELGQWRAYADNGRGFATGSTTPCSRTTIR
jgi:hypothetical protein